jgi:hypothetical protein
VARRDLQRDRAAPASRPRPLRSPAAGLAAGARLLPAARAPRARHRVRTVHAGRRGALDRRPAGHQQPRQGAHRLAAGGPRHRAALGLPAGAVRADRRPGRPGGRRELAGDQPGFAHSRGRGPGDCRAHRRLGHAAPARPRRRRVDRARLRLAGGPLDGSPGARRRRLVGDVARRDRAARSQGLRPRKPERGAGDRGRPADSAAGSLVLEHRGDPAHRGRRLGGRARGGPGRAARRARAAAGLAGGAHPGRPPPGPVRRGRRPGRAEGPAALLWSRRHRAPARSGGTARARARELQSPGAQALAGRLGPPRRRSRRLAAAGDAGLGAAGPGTAAGAAGRPQGGLAAVALRATGSPRAVRGVERPAAAAAAWARSRRDSWPL